MLSVHLVRTGWRGHNWDDVIYASRLCRVGSKRVFEPVLNHQTLAAAEGGPDAPHVVSNLIAKDKTIQRKLRTTMRSF
jgi:hypothetical protein